MINDYQLTELWEIDKTELLTSIKQAELSEVILADLEIAPFIIYKCGWTTEVTAMMDARKK